MWKAIFWLYQLGSNVRCNSASLFFILFNWKPLSLVNKFARVSFICLYDLFLVWLPGRRIGVQIVISLTILTVASSTEILLITPLSFFIPFFYGCWAKWSLDNLILLSIYICICCCSECLFFVYIYIFFSIGPYICWCLVTHICRRHYTINSLLGGNQKSLNVKHNLHKRQICCNL